jgi:hypothetical protein
MYDENIMYNVCFENCKYHAHVCLATTEAPYKEKPSIYEYRMCMRKTVNVMNIYN